jgi:hypothetical protein
MAKEERLIELAAFYLKYNPGVHQCGWKSSFVGKIRMLFPARRAVGVAVIVVPGFMF